MWQAILQKEWVDPQKFHTIIDKITQIENAQQHRGKGRPKNRAEKLRSVFRGRENEFIPLEDFVSGFQDRKGSRKYAITAISHLNHVLEDMDADVQIMSVTVTIRNCTKTFYRVINRIPCELF